jgi:uncharacterized protein
MKIMIEIGKLTVPAQLNGSSTAKKIYEALPISGNFSTWGDEIYFTIPVDAGLDESARKEVLLGDLGYWPTGKAFCIFFGPTPISRSGKIIPASAVNIVGKVLGDPTALRTVMNEREVRLTAE